MGDNLSLFFPPKLTLNDSSFPDLKDKVYIVTGASAGIGKELTRLLYSRNATVYLAARSAEKTNAAISWIQEQHPGSTGKLKYLHLQLSDLEGIKASAESFLAQETRLDVLFNNAAFLAPSGESHTKQGFEEHLGVNCIAPFLFTKLLTPVLLATAKKEEGAAKGSVRVVWVSSVAAGMRTPKGGLDLQDLDYKKKDPQGFRYAISKAGNLLHALEYRRRYGGEGVVGVAVHPGVLKSDLIKKFPAWELFIINLFTYPPVYGAYTELFAGLAPEVASIKESEWVVPWGRIKKIRKDFYSGKGTETAKAFWEWSEKQVENFT